MTRGIETVHCFGRDDDSLGGWTRTNRQQQRLELAGNYCRAADSLPFAAVSFALASSGVRESFCMTMAVLTEPPSWRSLAAVGLSVPVATLMIRWLRSTSFA